MAIFSSTKFVINASIVSEGLSNLPKGTHSVMELSLEHTRNSDTRAQEPKQFQLVLAKPAVKQTQLLQKTRQYSQEVMCGVRLAGFT